MRHGDKNKNKGPSVENQNALKEALSKIQDSKHEAPNSKQTQTQNQQIKNEPEHKSQNKLKEVPREELMRVLKGD